MRVYLALVLLSIAGCAQKPVSPANVHQSPEMLIADSRSLVSDYGANIWSNWPSAPFGVLLVGENQETLFCHGQHAAGFKPTSTNNGLDCDVQVRPRQFSPTLLASFPAVDGVSTIVIGLPGATGLSDAEWVLTVVHEHFHQFQQSFPGYYSETLALDLHGDDTSGMWMLNYPFPYEQPDVAKAFRQMGLSLHLALKAKSDADRRETAEIYFQKREAARKTVSEADWRYYEFQVWQEGVARWTEIEIGQKSENYEPTADAKYEDILANLPNINLGEDRRLSFYDLGAGEAALLNALSVEWQTEYWENRYQLRSALEILNAKMPTNLERSVKISTVK